MQQCLAGRGPLFALSVAKFRTVTLYPQELERKGKKGWNLEEILVLWFNHNKLKRSLHAQSRRKLVINLWAAAGFPITAPTHSGFNIIVLVNCGNAMCINDGLFQIGHCQS